MKRIIIALLLMLFADAQLIAQTNGGTSDFTVSTDSKNGNVVYKGRITPDDLQKEPSFSWYKRGIQSYSPDTETISYLKTHLQPYNIVVFLGTWCEDSHVMIPKLMRVLQDAGYKGKLTMYGVTRSKNTGNGRSQEYNISRVPVVVLEKDGKETGRITELTKISVEDDIAYMIKGETR